MHLETIENVAKGEVLSLKIAAPGANLAFLLFRRVIRCRRTASLPPKTARTFQQQA
jgi:hypothetical protein